MLVGKKIDKKVRKKNVPTEHIICSHFVNIIVHKRKGGLCSVRGIAAVEPCFAFLF